MASLKHRHKPHLPELAALLQQANDNAKLIARHQSSRHGDLKTIIEVLNALSSLRPADLHEIELLLYARFRLLDELYSTLNGLYVATFADNRRDMTVKYALRAQFLGIKTLNKIQKIRKIKNI